MVATEQRPGGRARKVGVASRPDAGGRFDTSSAVRMIVWVRAAGHCELCGGDLTRDLRTGKRTKWGDVAHILPASPNRGPRGVDGYGAAEAEALTNDVDNLMLLCKNCHTKGDRDAEGYPTEDLRGLHHAHLQRIKLAAQAPDAGRAWG